MITHPTPTPNEDWKRGFKSYKVTRPPPLTDHTGVHPPGPEYGQPPLPSPLLQPPPLPIPSPMLQPPSQPVPTSLQQHPHAPFNIPPMMFGGSPNISSSSLTPNPGYYIIYKTPPQNEPGYPISSVSPWQPNNRTYQTSHPTNTNTSQLFSGNQPGLSSGDLPQYPSSYPQPGEPYYPQYNPQVGQYPPQQFNNNPGQQGGQVYPPPTQSQPQNVPNTGSYPGSSYPTGTAQSQYPQSYPQTQPQQPGGSFHPPQNPHSFPQYPNGHSYNQNGPPGNYQNVPQFQTNYYPRVNSTQNQPQLPQQYPSPQGGGYQPTSGAVPNPVYSEGRGYTPNTNFGFPTQRNQTENPQLYPVQNPQGTISRPSYQTGSNQPQFPSGYPGQTSPIAPQYNPNIPQRGINNQDYNPQGNPAYPGSDSYDQPQPGYPQSREPDIFPQGGQPGYFLVNQNPNDPVVKKHPPKYNPVDPSKSNVKCPPGASGLYPHPDCFKFLSCDHGRTFVMSCGPGTAFNPALSVCDWPNNVDCGHSTKGGDPNFPEKDDEDIFENDPNTNGM